MMKFLFLVILILFLSAYGDALAYYYEHPPRSFKEGAPEHLEAEPVLDLIDEKRGECSSQEIILG